MPRRSSPAPLSVTSGKVSEAACGSANTSKMRCGSSVMSNRRPTVATTATQDYQATYGAPTCTYTYVPDTAPARTIAYNSTTGAVLVAP